jgi:hypothetical protein
MWVAEFMLYLFHIVCSKQKRGGREGGREGWREKEKKTILSLSLKFVNHYLKFPHFNFLSVLSFLLQKDGNYCHYILKESYKNIASLMLNLLNI